MVLIVEDLDRALSFYTDLLGLQLGHCSGDYAQHRTGATQLAFYTRKAMSKTLGYSLKPPSDAAPGFEIGFKVEDVDEVFRDCSEGRTGRDASNYPPLGTAHCLFS